MAHLFREIHYELNGIVVDSVTNLGITTTVKGYVSYTERGKQALGSCLVRSSGLLQ